MILDFPGVNTINGSLTEDYKFDLIGPGLLFSTVTISGKSGTVSAITFALYKGATVGSGTFVSDPLNPISCFGAGASSCSHDFTSEYSLGLGGDTGWLLTAGNYYVQATVTATTIHDGISGNVNLQAIPEISTWAMLGIGFAGIGLVGMTKRRKTSRYAL